jgi:hypothetical protein
MAAPPAPVKTHAERLGRCPRCAAFTYDVDGLSDEDVRRLILETEGRVLTRLVARRDGRVMSVDCGHGTVGRRSRAAVVALLLALAVAGAAALTLALRAAQPPADVPAPEEASSSPPAEALIEPAPLVSPPPAPSVEAMTGDAVEVGEAPRSAEVHLADVRSTWPPSVASVSQVAEALRAQLGPARACYEKRLEVSPSLRAAVSLSMTVDHGVVQDVRVTGSSKLPFPLPDQLKGMRFDDVVDRGPRPPEHEALQACVVEAMKSVSFTTPARATVWFRLVFEGW